jgi:predicted PurR-regulated permease PerM
MNLFNIVSPFLLAFGLAYVIYPLVKKLIVAGAPKWLAILTVCILGVGSLFIIIVLTVPLIYEQTLAFLSNISMFLSDLSTKYEINFGGLQSSLTDFSTDIISHLGSSISSGAISVVGSSVSVISTAIVSICAAIYFLIDMDRIRAGIKKYLMVRNRRTLRFLSQLDKEMVK